MNIPNPPANLDVAHGAVVISVGGDDDVDVFDDTVEGLVQLFLLQLQLQKSTVHFVHHENRPDTLGDGLEENGSEKFKPIQKASSSLFREQASRSIT